MQSSKPSPLWHGKCTMYVLHVECQLTLNAFKIIDKKSISKQISGSVWVSCISTNLILKIAFTEWNAHMEAFLNHKCLYATVKGSSLFQVMAYSLFANRAMTWTSAVFLSLKP